MGKEIGENGKEKVSRPWGGSEVYGASEPAGGASFPVCLCVGQEKPVQVMVDPADHVRIVGEPFEVTCVVTAPSHKYDIKWVTATNSVS